MTDPLITRKGVLTFDKQITGLRGIGDLTQSPVPMGLFQECIGVGWPSGFLIYAATSTGARPGLTLASSKDGVTWNVTSSVAPGDGGEGAIAGIAGNTKSGIVFVAGGFYTRSFPFVDNPAATISIMFPQFYISTDKGVSWRSLRPSWNTSVTASGAAGNTFTAGCVTGVGYNPDTETFYGVIQEHVANNINGPGGTFVANQILFSGDDNGFTRGSSQNLFSLAGPVQFNGCPQAPFPSGTFINDVAPTEDTSLTPPQPLYNGGQSVHFVSINAPGQHLSGGPLGNATVDMAGDLTISSTVGGFSQQGVSGTLSKEFLATVDFSGNVTLTPIDPATTSTGGQSFGGFSFADQTAIYLTSGGSLNSVISSGFEWASLSFSGAGNSNPT